MYGFSHVRSEVQSSTRWAIHASGSEGGAP